MVNNNNYPVEIPKTYTISYFNEAEWNKGLTPEEVAKNDEIAELVYRDNLLYDPKIGPGNHVSQMSDDEQRIEVLQRLGSLALTVSYFTPAAAITIPATVAGGAVGLGVEAYGHIADDNEAKAVGGFFRGVALDAVADGISAGGIKAAKGAKDVARIYSAVNAQIDMARGMGTHAQF